MLIGRAWWCGYLWVSGKVFDKTWDKVTAKKWYAQKLGKKPHKEIETIFYALIVTIAHYAQRGRRFWCIFAA